MPKTTSSEFDQDVVTQFMSVTGASVKDAKNFLDGYHRLDVAIEAYCDNPHQFGMQSPPNTINRAELKTLFDQYRFLPSEPDILMDGTIKLCDDLQVDPEDVVLLAVAYELKAPTFGVFTLEGWQDGWQSLHVDSIPAMKNALIELRGCLASDFQYFRKVYLYTFDLANEKGQRRLPMESAQALWGLLLPQVAIEGGASSHTDDDDDGEVVHGWTNQHTQLWLKFLNGKGGRGVSRDTWVMFIEFARTIDCKMGNYDSQAAWPSLIEDFVEWAKQHGDL